MNTNNYTLAHAMINWIETHNQTCEWCIQGYDGCETAQRVEDLMLRLDPQAYNRDRINA
jgi:hypothetical protein